MTDDQTQSEAPQSEAIPSSSEVPSESHDGHSGSYVSVFIALCVFTALSVAFDLFSFENKAVTAVLVLAVAAAKASCVLLFFMHLKFEGGWKYLVLAPTTILALGLPMALWPDIGTDYYPTSAPQVEWLQQAQSAGQAQSESP